MKIIIALIAFVALVVAKGDQKTTKEEKTKFLEKIAAECSEEIGFDLASAQKLLLGDLSFRSDEAKCFVRCFFRKEGFLNEADEPQADFIVDSLEDGFPVARNKLRKIVSKCTRFKSDDACENSYGLLECFFKALAAAQKGEL